VLHFANSGDQALQLLDNQIEPELFAVLSDISRPAGHETATPNAATEPASLAPLSSSLSRSISTI
jgi:hypothetical protein